MKPRFQSFGQSQRMKLGRALTFEVPKLLNFRKFEFLRSSQFLLRSHSSRMRSYFWNSPSI